MRAGAAQTDDSKCCDQPPGARRFCISDAEVLELADHAIRIEAHYSAHAGHPMPMDIEWAKDGEDGLLYILQARPETVASQREPGSFETYTLKQRRSGAGHGPGGWGEDRLRHRAASSAARAIWPHSKPASSGRRATSPDWEPVMKRAAAIVTARGGRTCHAAIVARELGVPAVVGAGDAINALTHRNRRHGVVRRGRSRPSLPGTLAVRGDPCHRPALRGRGPAIMVNLGNPELAFHTAMLPNDGVGLARMEFIISEHIGMHPMALVHPEKVDVGQSSARDRAAEQGYDSPTDFFVETLAEGVGMIAAAFYPKPVIVRLSDFKTNEYASLLGGAAFEPKEANPMLGFRGASRYAHPAYAEGFALECAALSRVRDEMGLTNLRIMVPFCRRAEEGAAGDRGDGATTG